MSPLRVLIVEDSESDARLIIRRLEQGAYVVESMRVEDAPGMQEALTAKEWDLVIADFTMPRFDASGALATLQNTGKDIPFIVVSGTVGEEVAVTMLKKGANDYLLKDHLTRLVPAVQRELRDVLERRERRRAEHELRDIHDQLRHLLAHSPAVIFKLRIDGAKVVPSLVSDNIQRLLGCTQAECMGREWWLERIHPDDRERVLGVFADGLRHEGFSMEYRIRNKDGTYRWIQENTRILRDATGRPYEAVGVWTDVTERKHNDERVRTLSCAVEQSSASVMITNPAGDIEYVNAKFTDLTGYAFDEVRGRNPCLLKSGEMADEEYKRLWDTITRGGEWRGEFHNKKKNGELYWEFASISPILDESGRITHFLAVKEDIAEKKQLQAQVLRTQRLESIGELAGGIAHDLNNILAPILMSCELLRTTDHNEHDERFLATIETSARRGVELVKQVLTFARGTVGARNIVQLRHLILEMVKVARSTFAKTIRVTSSVPGDLQTVIGDPTQLHQVLMNLCVNARDAMPEGGSLRLSAANAQLDASEAAAIPDARPGEYVLIQVSDTGTGIAPHIKDRMFEPFFTTKEKGKGTGLGLSTVLGIVRSHGGFVTVESEIDHGTTFKIFLPAGGGPSPAACEAMPNNCPVGEGQLILVVDDEDAVCVTTDEVLSTYGYQVTCAHNGAEALVLYLQHHQSIRVVITDLDMPVMSGVPLINALRRINPAVNVIVMSGTIDPEQEQALRAVNVERFLLKPFHTSELLITIRDMLSLP